MGCARGGSVVCGDKAGLVNRKGVGKGFRPMMGTRRSSMTGWLNDCTHYVREERCDGLPQ